MLPVFPNNDLRRSRFCEEIRGLGTPGRVVLGLETVN